MMEEGLTRPEPEAILRKAIELDQIILLEAELLKDHANGLTIERIERIMVLACDNASLIRSTLRLIQAENES